MLRVLALLVVSTSLAGGVACRATTPPPAPRDAAFVLALNRGVAAMGQYDFDAAVETFAALAQSHPTDAAVGVNLALAHINRQRDGDAAEAERRLGPLTGNPDVGTRARYALGLLQLYAGREAEASAPLAAVAAAAPDDAYAAYFAGQARLGAAPAEALAHFERALAIDPLLRSAHYGAFQALQRLGRDGEAQAALERFQALERDPRAATAEFKYTRMGPLAMAFTVDAPAAAPAAPPAGAPFAGAVNHAPADRWPWRPVPPGAITAADLDGNGHIDLFLANAVAGNAPNTVSLRGHDTVAIHDAHPLSRVAGVRSALWGDIDDDGLLDVVLLRAGGTTIWRQAPAGQWRDVTAAMRAATADIDAVDGALFDADHDGDLDIWLVNARGSNELLNNNGDGTFRRIAAQAGLAGDRRPSRGVAVADLDGDRDHDLVVLKASPPHEVFLNDRVWQYRAAPGFEALRNAELGAVVAADRDADGQVELYTASARGLERWQPDATGTWTAAPFGRGATAARGPLAIADVDGDGGLDLVAGMATGWAAWSMTAPDEGPLVDESASGVTAWAVVHSDPIRGPSVFGLSPAGLLEWAPGADRPPYVVLAPSGREIASDQRRSNSSGIGTRIAVRAGSQWTAIDTVRTSSGPGQSLQPVSIGLGGSGGTRADFVSLVWPDGILQTEIGLAAGQVHRLEETQRQLSSCPVLFADDGTGLRFVTDLLGVGGIGFFERPGVYSPPHPHERVLLPEGALTPRDGRYRLALGEPMEEVAYLDRAALRVYDLPPGWHLALDERKAIAGPPPTGAAIFYRELRTPVRAVNDRDQDVTAALATADLTAAPPGAIDPRFIGRTARHSVTLEFDEPIAIGPGAPVLLADGWVEYPYAQTVFSAWQAGAPYQAPTLEARDGHGRWRVVAAEFGYPAGMPRQMTFPLSDLPAGARALRLTTTQEIYWDRLAVIYAEAAPGVVVHELPPVTADLQRSGFARRTTGPQRTPHYDYAHRAPLLDTRHPRGWYSRLGDVQPLVAADDDAVAIFGPGEEVRLEFEVPEAAVPSGWTRRVVLDAKGWCKDMDLYTLDGDTVGPLPGRESPARRTLHAAYNTRYEGGR
ncbi:MAG: FG-GAP-like repeat-containing protein [Vicinamibacterales bacterium]